MGQRKGVSGALFSPHGPTNKGPSLVLDRTGPGRMGGNQGVKEGGDCRVVRLSAGQEQSWHN